MVRPTLGDGKPCGRSDRWWGNHDRQRRGKGLGHRRSKRESQEEKHRDHQPEEDADGETSDREPVKSRLSCRERADETCRAGWQEVAAMHGFEWQLAAHPEVQNPCGERGGNGNGNQGQNGSGYRNGAVQPCPKQHGRNRKQGSERALREVLELIGERLVRAPAPMDVHRDGPKPGNGGDQPECLRKFDRGLEGRGRRRPNLCEAR